MDSRGNARGARVAHAFALGTVVAIPAAFVVGIVLFALHGAWPLSLILAVGLWRSVRRARRILRAESLRSHGNASPGESDARRAITNNSHPVEVDRLRELLGRIFYAGPASIALGLVAAIALPGSSGWVVGGGMCGVGALVIVLVPLVRNRLKHLGLPTANADTNYP